MCFVWKAAMILWISQRLLLGRHLLVGRLRSYRFARLTISSSYLQDGKQPGRSGELLDSRSVPQQSCRTDDDVIFAGGHFHPQRVWNVLTINQFFIEWEFIPLPYLITWGGIIHQISYLFLGSKNLKAPCGENGIFKQCPLDFNLWTGKL